MGVVEKVLVGADELQSLMILLVGADDVPIKGQLKFQKIMYLLADRIEKNREQSNYESDMLGPYSEVVDEEYQYLKIVGVFTANPYLISLSPEGKKIAEQLKKKEKPQVMELIHDYKEFLNNMTSDELLCFMYSAYPDMTSESVKYQQLLPIMEDTILKLVKKKKISAERAAELLNKKYDYIIKCMKEKGIPVFLD